KIVPIAGGIPGAREGEPDTRPGGVRRSHVVRILDAVSSRRTPAEGEAQFGCLVRGLRMGRAEAQKQEPGLEKHSVFHVSSRAWLTITRIPARKTCNTPWTS